MHAGCFYLALFFAIATTTLHAQQPGNTLAFDGANDYVNIPASLTTAATLSTNTAITIEYWFRGSSLQSAVRMQNGSNNYVIAGYNLQHVISSDGGTNNGVAISNVVYDGRWHHIAMTWQKNTINGFKSYVDGVLYAQRNSANVNLPTITIAGKLGSYNGNSEFTNGKLDEVRIYNAALSQTNIQFDMVNSTSQLTSNLLAYYNFNQGTAGGTNTGITTLTDGSVNARHASLVNFALNSSNNNSNWIESYAMVLPTASAASAINSSGFTANWTAPAIGVVNNYLLDVSTTSDFTGIITGSPFDCGSSLTYNVTGLLSGTYYYRVRANKTSVAGQGLYSSTITVTVPYSNPGNALSFDGSNDNAVINKTITDDFTIEYWVKTAMSSYSGTQWYQGSGIVDGDVSSNSNDFGTSILNNKLAFGTGSTTIQSTTSINSGKWVHVAVTREKSTGLIKIYINGLLETSGSGGTNTLNAASTLNLGKIQTNSNYFNGAIDELRIWNVVRTQGQISASYTDTLSRTTPNIVDYYRMDQGVGGGNNTGVTTLVDIAGTNNGGTINNFGLNGLTSNWIESYAMVVPTLAAPNINSSGFTINWTAPTTGSFTNFVLDVSTSSDFTGHILNSPFTLGASAVNYLLTNLKSGKYYYRIRANKDFTTVSNQGAYSNTDSVLVPYSNPGNALNFDGVNDYVALPNSLPTAITNSANTAITIEYWFRGTSLQSAVRIQNASGYIVAGYNNQHIISTDGSTTNGLTVGAGATDGHWHHIAMTWQKNASFKSYLDGKLVASRNATANANLPVISNGAFIGSSGGASDFTNGSIDEVRIYNAALTQANIQSDMVSTSSSMPSNLLAYYNFDNGVASAVNTSSNMLADNTSNSYNGILKNFASSGSTSNWVESYAMIVPTLLPSTSITASGFTINWAAPAIGSLNKYILDVSTSSDFTGPILNSPFTLSSTVLSQNIINLKSGHYYYRIRANKDSASVNNQGAYSKIDSALVPFSPPGNTLKFDGANDYVGLPSTLTSAITSNNAITIEYWFRGSNIQSAVRMNTSTGYINAGWGLTPGSQLHVISSDGGTTNGLPVGAAAVDGRWHHIAMCWQKNTVNGFRSYLDGQLVAQRNSANVSLPIISAATYFGSLYGTSEFMNGSLDEVRIYKTALSQSDIQTDMMSTTSSSPANLIAWYNFDQGVNQEVNSSSTVLLDKTGNGYNGNLYNFGLGGLSSNWIESYAMVVPDSLTASSINASGFTLNWTAPTYGTANNYILEVYANPLLSNPVSGSPFTISSTSFSKTFTGLGSGTYYYRISADKNSLSAQGCFSAINSVIVPYSPPGNALSFDGTNDFVSVNDNTVGNFGTSNFTVEFWLKTNSVNTTGLVNKRAVCGHTSFWNIYLGSGKINCEVDQDANATNYKAITGNKIVNDNHWHHIAFVRNGVSISMYIDGNLESSANGAGVANISNTGKIQIGNNCSSYFNGSIDELRIWNLAKTQTEIQLNMKTTVSTSSSNLISYYNFDQGLAGSLNTGSTDLTDQTSAGKNGTLNYFTLNGVSSNWIESYAMVAPELGVSTNITSTGFTANWTAPTIGIVDTYYVDLSTISNFSSVVAGSPFKVAGNLLTKTITGLHSNFNYYLRVRADKNSVSGQGNYSDVKNVKTNSTLTPPGNALSFDGVDDYIVIPASTGINNQFATNRITLEGWFKIKSLPAAGSAPAFISESYLGDGNIKFGVWLESNLVVAGCFVNNTWYRTYATSPITLNRWTHLAATYDQSQIKLYVNGVLVSSINATIALPPGTEEWRIGRRWDLANYLDGTFDEIKIYNEALSQLQVNHDMMDSAVSLPANLVAYYNFDEGTAAGNNIGINLLTDQRANPINGQLQNFALTTGSSSNWVSSYAMAIPAMLDPTNITNNGFKINWLTPLRGSRTNYIVDVSLTSNFTALINGSPFSINPADTFLTLSSLPSGTFYFRVRANDSNSTNANQGAYSLTQSATLLFPPPGNALSFDGVNDYVPIPKNISGDFTIEYWMKSNMPGRTGTNWWQGNGIVDGDISNTNGDFGTSLLNGHLAFGIGYSGHNLTIQSTSFINTGKWTHVAVTRQMSSGVFKIYINGNLEATGTAGKNALSSSSTLTIGKLQTGAYFFEGSIDELRIWNVVRSDAAIASNYLDTVASDAAGLVDYYTFDQGIKGGVSNTGVSTLIDLTVTNNGGNLTNFALNGNTSNWVESYALVVPTVTPATAINASGFTANWTAPKLGAVSNYFMDVSTLSNFSSPILGSPFTLNPSPLNKVIGGLTGGTYYYRNIADKSGTATSGQGGYSNTISVDVPYSPPGNALAFDGLNDFVSINNTALGNFGTSNFTVEFWMKTGSINGAIIGKRPSCGHSHFWNIILTNGKIVCELDQNRHYYLNLVGKSVINDLRWHHIAMVRNGNHVSLFIDGKLDATGVTGTGTTNVSNNTKLSIGRVCTYFNGSIDELRLWSAALNPSDVQTAMKAPVSVTAPGLNAYYKFDQGVGGNLNYGITTLLDATANHYDGTLTNMLLEALNTNWVQSYAMVVPTQLDPTNLTNSSFTLNWAAPLTGTFTNYLVDVSQNPAFTAPVSGSPFYVSPGTTSLDMTGMAPSTYYIRVRVDKTSQPYSGEGAPSNVKTIVLDYIQPGNALAFDGTNDYGVIPKTITDNFTIEFWVKTSMNSNTGSSWSQGNGIVDGEASGSNDFGTSILNNKLAFGVGSTTIQSFTSINSGKWVHVAVTREKSTGLIRIYINGAQDMNGSSNTNTLNASSTLTLGKIQTNSNYFNGAIDELRIWNVVRTGAQIAASYTDTLLRTTLNLVDYYRMDQGTGGGTNTGVTTLIDIAGTNNGGTINNFGLNGFTSNWVPSYNMTVNGPSALTATQTNCSTIDLSWQISTTPTSNADVSVFSDQSNFRQNIYANDTLIATLPYNTTSYSFNVNQYYNNDKLVRGIAYNFTVRSVYVPPLFQYTKTSSPSNVAVGQFKPQPTTPAGFTATNNKCDATIDLSWIWNEANPTGGFVLERSIDSSFDSPDIFLLTGDKRNLTDQNLVRGQYYLYRISSRNNCFNPLAVDTMAAGQSDTMVAIQGISPAVPTRPSNIRLFADSTTNIIYVRWNDNSTNEDKFTVERTAAGGGTSSYEVNANDTVYEDVQAMGCVNYNYTIKAFSGCATSGISSLGLFQTRLTPNIDSTFVPNTSYSLTCSKGYYSDRVELAWDNRNTAQLTSIRIYRKPALSAGDSIVIASLPVGTNIYFDNTAVAGVLYKYFLFGVMPCGGTTQFSNSTTDIGFRSPTGTIAGNVAFAGGFAVDGAKILAQNNSASTGGSVSLDGINDYLTIPHKTTQNPSANALTIELWYKPYSRKSCILVSKTDSINGGYLLQYDSASNKLRFIISNSTSQQVAEVNNPFGTSTSFNQITAVYGSDSMRIYINGIEATAIPTLIQSMGATQEALYFGGSPLYNIYGKGFLDEIRLFQMAKAHADVIKDYNRTVTPNNVNLFLYLTFDDRFPGLTQSFDGSNNNQVFNENHTNFVNGALYSDTVPSSNQLSLTAYTDIKGNYIFEGVRYTGTGQNFTVVPTLNIHVFTPANLVVFIGDGLLAQNNINFTDNSSFSFTGNVAYAGTTCPAGGASILIDGIAAVVNGEQVLVNDSGKFTIQVPIGSHVVTLSQDYHTFSAGRFPPTGSYNFNSPLSVNFKDSTLLKVVGRVVGGNTELIKAPGMGRSKNNIGKAQFTFNSVGQSGTNGCFTKSVITNDSSGEYTAYLYPMRYTIDGLKLVNNPGLNLNEENLNNPNILDLSVIPLTTTVVDTLKTGNTYSIDSITYHSRVDFKYYVTPEIFLTNTNTAFDSLVNNFIGETSITLNDTTVVDISHNEFGYPVFYQALAYTAKVKVVEIYHNADSSASMRIPNDLVGVSGTINFINDLAAPDDTTRSVSVTDGKFDYTFKTGNPNNLRNALYPGYSYTKTLQIEFVPDLGSTINYQPNKNDIVNKFYRGFIFGARSSGANFTTAGPALVDFVLHDPPGSASSSSWVKGTAYSKTESWSVADATGGGTTFKVALGVDITVVALFGIGAQVGTSTETESKSEVAQGVTSTTTRTHSGELVNTTSSNTTISSGSDPGSVGSSADIYYGKSQNILFGNTDVIQLLDSANCAVLANLAGVEVCTGPIVNGLQIGKLNGFYVVPGTINTTFAYTQDEILNLIIPDLQNLRNQLLTGNVLNSRGQKKYTNMVNTTDPLFALKYASNNDDPLWGALRSSPNPFTFEARDSTGESYLFRGNTPKEPDSIRIYNQQIRLWKNAIANNEKTKYDLFRNNNISAVSGGRNISLGKASFSQDFTSQVDNNHTESFEVSTGSETGVTLGININGIGTESASTFTFEKTTGDGTATTSTTLNTFSYSLQDGDDGDLITVDVLDPKDGNSHFFKLIAGRTSCPYEGAETALFYNPDNDTITSHTMLSDGVELQPATAQNDVPVISVDQKSLYNVPAKDPAVFILQLGNNSDGRQDRTYSLRVDPASNPFGAIIKVNGLDPNRDFDVPYGTTIQQTLTIEKGPLQYDYNNIRFILKSACDDDIFDTVSVSAKFLPTCTNIALNSPDDKWVLNTFNKDTLPVIMGNYNYNFGGFKNVHFQYKPGSSNTWYDEKIFYKDTPDAKIKIPLGTPYISYPFSFKNLTDGIYQLRAVTDCIAPGYPDTRINSTVLTGIVDRINPVPFGTPTPANGIWSPDSDISIQFNEPIDQSSISPANFEVKGVLNQSDARSNISIYLDGDEDYLEVDQRLDLSKKSLTFEFWHQRMGLGQQVLLSQGADINNSIEIGFNANDKLYFRINGTTVTSNATITDTSAFNFYAISYDAVKKTADIIQNATVLNTGNNAMVNPYTGSGKFYMGKLSFGSAKYTKGKIYEVRVWGVARSVTDVNNTKSKLLTGTEQGLMANWRMDEAEGTMVTDYVRSRNAIIVNAEWDLFPSGNSIALNGAGDYITIPTAKSTLGNENDFTFEFWFKADTGNSVGLLSNGKGLATDINPDLKWCIETDSSGRILVKHNGLVFQATNKNYFDGNWHHLAVVKRYNSFLTSYIDGNQENSATAANFKGIGGAKMWIGCRGWNNAGNPIYDSTSNNFIGKMDDVRLWTISRLQEQIARDKNHRLNGNEVGLAMYLPFESYDEVLGVPVLTPSARIYNPIKDTTFTMKGNSYFSIESPNIKLPRTAQNVDFTYGVTSDKIIITPTTPNQYIEGVTLDISVRGIKDKNGNVMQSPKSWIALMNRTLVRWMNEDVNLKKLSGAPLSFTINIKNLNGKVEPFSISQLPAWLTASPVSGEINPNSQIPINFTVDPTLNIGHYEDVLSLNTDFGYAETAHLKLHVYAQEPDWKINPSDYSKSMSIVGQVRINNVISSNTDDILGAFVNNVCRGIAKVEYYQQLDKYLVFMDVYSNTNNEMMEFRIWNSATGKTHIQIDPSIKFISDSLVGSVNAPQIFNALDKVSEQILLNKGWNWVSFNLLMTDSANLNTLFSNLKPFSGNQIKTNTQLAIYDATNGWSGNLASLNAGVKPECSYLIYVGQQDTLNLRGSEANPELRTIMYNKGWNCMGFVAQRNMLINEALSDLNAKQNDLVKGQNNFAIYDSTLGWVGSLKTMIPNEGYQYKASDSGFFNYPLSAMFGKKEPENNLVKSAYWSFNSHKFAGNMSLIAKVTACSNLQNTQNFLLGAFVNDELRGFTKPVSTNANDQAYFLNIAGGENENISFKLLDESTGNVYNLDQSIAYNTNAITGTLSEPFILSSEAPCIANKLSGAFSTNVYPVPFNESLTIGFNLPQNDKISIRVIDISGKELGIICNEELYKKGAHELNWKATNMPTGVYILEIQISGNTVRHKIIKL